MMHVMLVKDNKTTMELISLPISSDMILIRIEVILIHCNVDVIADVYLTTSSSDWRITHSKDWAM